MTATTTPFYTDRGRLSSSALACYVPTRLIGSLVSYVADRRPTGGFLRAVLENDLSKALRRADPQSLAGLKDIMRWLRYHTPSNCWGSPTAVKTWLAARETE